MKTFWCWLFGHKKWSFGGELMRFRSVEGRDLRIEFCERCESLYCYYFQGKNK